MQNPGIGLAARKIACCCPPLCWPLCPHLLPQIPHRLQQPVPTPGRHHGGAVRLSPGHCESFKLDRRPVMGIPNYLRASPVADQTLPARSLDGWTPQLDTQRGLPSASPSTIRPSHKTASATAIQSATRSSSVVPPVTCNDPQRAAAPGLA